MLRLLICDDAPDAREAVKVSLAEQPDIEVVGEAERGDEAVSAAASLRPDVILMDVKMPVLDGIAATKQIRDLLPRARIVAFAGSDDIVDIVQTLSVTIAVQIRPDDRADPSKSPDSEQSFSFCGTRHAPHPRRTPTI